MSAHLLTLLETLPGAYAGPDRPEEGPYGLVGTGEGTLAAHLAQSLVPGTLARSGTQFVLGSPDAGALATDYADLATVAGAQVRRVATGGTPEEIDVLVPGGPWPPTTLPSTWPTPAATTRTPAPPTPCFRTSPRVARPMSRKATRRATSPGACGAARPCCWLPPTPRPCPTRGNSSWPAPPRRWPCPCWATACRW
ncbi:hypothetical protein [Deinococcus multiflagellatus]|uniref:Phosphoglucose isomerase N-terminal domain-containing protein n=1 Tax=Deinococcus multiflagellatus TaxID=1656887 RepID=A0ABW1ZI67_9DEIO